MLFNDLINVDLGLMILRIVTAFIFLYHGLPKLSKAKQMSQMIGASVGMVFVMGLVEILSAIALVVGYQVQLASVLLGIIMVGAILMKMVKWNVGFAAKDKTGWEFDLILLASCATIFLANGGSLGL